MEENNLSENNIIINQVIPKEKNINGWAFFIPVIQIFGCGFFLLMSLGLCGWPGDGRGSNCSLGYTIGLIDVIIFFGFPIFVLIFSFIKSKFNHKKMVFPTASFIISSVLPLLVLGFYFWQTYSFNKEMGISKKQIEYRNNIISNKDNYSIITAPATEITNHGAILNALI